MTSIYRVRPAKLKSVEEIQEHYLWFSRTTSYWDEKDANIFAFLKENESIETAFANLFKDHKEVARLAGLSGICCFSESMPDPGILGDFPAAKNGFVIEYSKEKLELFFLKKYGIGDCFKKVEYSSQPTLFASSGQYHILWEQIGEDKIYRSLNEITSSEKSMDAFFLKMFTRISDDFSNQQELRIILGGSNVPDKSDGILGYLIQIPAEAIKKIHMHKDIKQSIKELLEQSGYELATMD